MGEPCLITREQYLKLWEQYNPLGRACNEIQEVLLMFILGFGINGIIAAEIYGSGHSRSGPMLMVVFLIIFALCLCFSGCVQWYKRRRFNLWEQHFPYDPEREFSTKHFAQEI